MHSFGYDTADGLPLYPCRVVHDGEVTIGRYDDANKSCHISYGFTFHEVSSSLEVLTIPGGLENDCNEYN